MEHLKTIHKIMAVVILFCLTSCNALAHSSKAPDQFTVMDETQAAADPSTSLPFLNTTMGEFVIVTSRLVDEIHGDKPLPGNKFLLVVLAGPEMAKLEAGIFSLEEFQKMVTASGDDIYILGKDNVQTFSSGMGGWAGEEFVMGFMVPESEPYTLYWPENSPVELILEK